MFLFKNYPLVRAEFLERSIKITFEIIWEGKDFWALVSVDVLELIPDIELLTIFHIRILALGIGLYFGWGY